YTLSLHDALPIFSPLHVTRLAPAAPTERAPLKLTAHAPTPSVRRNAAVRPSFAPAPSASDRWPAAFSGPAWPRRSRPSSVYQPHRLLRWSACPEHQPGS